MNPSIHRGAAAAMAAITACAVAWAVTGTASAAKNGPPLINIEGSSYTNNRVVNGLTRQTQFSMAAKESRDGTISGTFADQLYNVAPDGTSTQIAFTNMTVACLSADTVTGTVWFSGQVTAADDQRLPSAAQAQEQQILDDGNLILIGRFADPNGDGIVDTRSVFGTLATTGYPNAFVASSDNGVITSPWFINGNGTSAANACLLHDSAFTAADYKVVDGETNQVQWLAPDDATTVGDPFTGTAANLSDAPAQSIYGVASITLTLLSPTLELTIR